MNISLLGYMGAGKSVVGKQLSDKMGLPFIDLDKYIEFKENQKIADIFEIKGEIYFRKIESQYLKEVLNQKEFILSLGGGTPVFYNHMELINEHSISFYLHASPDVLAKRLSRDKAKRPLIAHLDVTALEEFIAKHLFERNAFYQQAHYTLSTANLGVSETADKILSLIKYHQNQT